MAQNTFTKPKLGLLPHARYGADTDWINQQLGYLTEDEREKFVQRTARRF